MPSSGIDLAVYTHVKHYNIFDERLPQTAHQNLSMLIKRKLIVKYFDNQWII